MELCYLIHDNFFNEIRVDNISFYVPFWVFVHSLFDSQDGVRHPYSKDDAGVHLVGQDSRLLGGGGELQDSVFDGLRVGVVVGPLADLRAVHGAEGADGLRQKTAGQAWDTGHIIHNTTLGTLHLV